MTQIVSSISGIEIYAPSAGNAPTNSSEVSSIASAYQVVSATGTQLYAGTAFLTGVNDAPVSASRAGQAANASLANSSYYDGTGRLISALPDSAAVSSIASSYAEAAASSKLDTTAFNSGDFYSTSNPSGFITGVDLTAYQEKSAMTAYQPSGDYYSATNPSGFITGVDLSDYATTSYVDSSVSGKLDTTAQVVSSTAGDGTYVTAINGMGISGQGGGGGATGDYVEKSAVAVIIGSGNTSFSANNEFVQGTNNSTNASQNVLVQGKGNTARVNCTFIQGEGNYCDDSYNMAVGFYNNTNRGYAIGSQCSASSLSLAVGEKNMAEYRSFAQGSSNTALSASFAQGSSNSASSVSFAQGELNSASYRSFAQGRFTLATSQSFAQGFRNSATTYSFAQGSGNSAANSAFAQGNGNTSTGNSLAQGTFNSATTRSFAQGDRNTASMYAFAQGSGNSATNDAFAQGFANSASAYSFAQGIYISAKNTAAVFGQYNLHGDGNTSTGNSAAFAIGDGTATGARHDLMVVTKDGEITMYSSTADTTGTGIMSAIRAISAAATGGGGGGIDSATCSAIASSYAESAASSRMYSSAMQVVANSSQATANGVLYILTGGV